MTRETRISCHHSSPYKLSFRYPYKLSFRPKGEILYTEHIAAPWIQDLSLTVEMTKIELTSAYKMI